mmetsp:Transcript_9807/g.19315  ORF Transcript_9807/g.19315 Transcript_9807/m.19315 type:complete len:212 (-) Transcript_9807:35-670(-)
MLQDGPPCEAALLAGVVVEGVAQLRVDYIELPWAFVACGFCLVEEVFEPVTAVFDGNSRLVHPHGHRVKRLRAQVVLGGLCAPVSFLDTLTVPLSRFRALLDHASGKVGEMLNGQSVVGEHGLVGRSLAVVEDAVNVAHAALLRAAHQPPALEILVATRQLPATLRSHAVQEVDRLVTPDGYFVVSVVSGVAGKDGGGQAAGQEGKDADRR